MSLFVYTIGRHLELYTEPVCPTGDLSCRRIDIIPLNASGVKLKIRIIEERRIEKHSATVTGTRIEEIEVKIIVNGETEKPACS